MNGFIAQLLGEAHIPPKILAGLDPVGAERGLMNTNFGSSKDKGEEAYFMCRSRPPSPKRWFY